jgi:hypothetical protein
MAAISLQDLATAQKEFMQARAQALQAATPQAAQVAELSALGAYLQARVKLLTNAKNQTLQQFDDQIATFQERIGELHQQIAEAATPAPAPLAAPTGGSASGKAASPPAAPATDTKAAADPDASQSASAPDSGTKPASKRPRATRQKT